MNLRARLQQGQATLGSWLQLPSADTAEIMANMGYDWLVVDMEHGSIDVRDLPNILRAMHCAPKAPTPLVRVPTVDTLAIRRALDAGAAGLIFPMVHSRDVLDKAIDAALYPQKDTLMGVRGVGYARTNVYGQDFDNYMSKVDQELIFIAQIEHVDAVNELEAIVSHPRLDAVMVGPYDLSASMGLMGNFEHKLFKQAMNEIQQTCQKHHMPMGTHVVTPHPGDLQKAIDAGYTFVAYGIDAVFLWQAAACPTLHKGAL